MNNSKKTIYTVGIGLMTLVCLSFLSLGCQKTGAPKITVIKLSHGLDIQHPVHLAMVFMKERLAEKSGGTIELQIFPNGQLGSERETVELVQLGCLEMVKASCAQVESFIPELGVFSVPYIFRDSDHYWNVLNGPIGEELLLKGEKVGLRGLCYYDAGSRSFYTKNKNISTPDDLVGMKIRVMQSKTSMDMVKALGGNPTPITWGELYTSLQQGVVDGAENNPPSFFTSRHFEVCKVFSLDEHTRIPDILMISIFTWKKYSPEVQRMVQEAAQESSAYERDLWEKMTRESIENVKENGVKVVIPDKQLFVDKVTPMYKSFEGKPIGEYIKRIRETQ